MKGASRSARLVGLSLLTLLLPGVAAAQAPPASLLVPTTHQRPDEFGTQDYTVTVIDATSFTADTPYTTNYGSLSRLFLGDAAGHFYAGVNVPSGVVIDFIGLQSRCGEPFLVATLFYVDRYSGTTSGIVSLQATTHDWDTDYNASPLGWQLTQNAHNALVLDVYQPPTDPLYHCPFGWVEIWWKRVVSPAPGTASFNDVPTNHPFFQYIEALKASGITGGCGAGIYCPDSSLTRGQMAVFLAKALGLHWPN